jgi:hypothetical protein
LLVLLYLRNCLDELVALLFAGLSFVEEVGANGGEEDNWMVVVSLVLAAVVDSVDQAHIAFLWYLDVYEISEQLHGVWLGELLENEGSVLFVLSEHLVE